MLHFPWPYFPNAKITTADSTALIPDLNSASALDFVWYTPNVIDDEDAGTVQNGDAFLSTFIPQVQDTAWYKAGGQIIIEWDESAGDSSGLNGGTGGGRIPTIVVSAALAAHPVQEATPVDQIGILSSIESVYGLSYLGFAGDGFNGDINALLSASGEPPTTTVPVTSSSTTAPPVTTTTAPDPTTTTTQPDTTATAPSDTTTTAPPVTTTTAPDPTTTTTPPETTTSGTSTTTAPPTSSTTRPTTSTSAAPVKTVSEKASGARGTSPADAVTAPSSALALTGSGPALGWTAYIGPVLVLAGLALFAAAESARRLRRIPVSADWAHLRSRAGRAGED